MIEDVPFCGCTNEELELGRTCDQPQCPNAGASPPADSRARSLDSFAHLGSRTRHGWALRVWLKSNPFHWIAIPFWYEEEANQFAFELIDAEWFAYSIRPADINYEVTTA